MYVGMRDGKEVRIEIRKGPEGGGKMWVRALFPRVDDPVYLMESVLKVAGKYYNNEKNGYRVHIAIEDYGKRAECKTNNMGINAILEEIERQQKLENALWKWRNAYEGGYRI